MKTWTVRILSLAGVIGLMWCGPVRADDDFTTTQTQSGVITDGSTPTKVNVYGSGVVFTFNNSSNSYTGGTVVYNGGTIGVDSDGELGGASSAVTLGYSGLGGTATFQFNASTTIAHSIILSDQGGIINPNGYTGIITPAITGTGGLTVDGSGTLTLSGANTFSGGLTLNGSSTVILNGANTYTGGTTVSSGTLQVGSTAGPTASITDGADAITVGGGALIVGGSGSTGASVTSSGIALSSGTVTVGAYGSTGASVTGGVTLTGGTLNGIGTVDTVTNTSGTVSPGNSSNTGTLTIGTFSQGASGTLGINLYPSGSNSKLAVTNVATLGGALNLYYQNGSYHAGQSFTFLTAGSFSGSFATESYKLASATLNTTLTVTGTSYTVSLTQGSLPDYPTVFSAMTTTLLNEGQQTNQTVLSRLQSARTSALADSMASAFTLNHRFPGSTPFGVWVQPTGTLNSQDGNSGAPGFTSSTYGFMTGIDGQIANGVAIGAAIGINRIELDEKGGANGTVDVSHLAAYGGWWRGRLALDGMVGIGIPNISTNRPVSGTQEIAEASYSGKEYSAALQASLNFKLRDWTISPAGGIKYLYMTQTGFTETDTDEYNITNPNQYSNSLRPFIHGTALRRYSVFGGKMALVPELTLGYEQELSSTNRVTTVQSENDITKWTIPGVTPAAGTFNAKAGVTLETSHSGSYYFDYDREQNGESNSNAFMAGYRYRL